MAAVNLIKVQHLAAELKRLLEYYAPQNPEAAMCLRELSPLLDGVLAGTAKLPLQGVPCSWHFHWGGIREFGDLEEAYSQFAFDACGLDSEKLHKFSQRLDVDQKFAARMLSPELTWWENIWSGWSRLMHRLKR